MPHSMPNATLPHEIYVEELSPCGHGYPLYRPEPTIFGEVLIGDVGFFEDGAFHRLFNATRPADGPKNNRCRVPDDLEQYPIPLGAVTTNADAIPVGILHSSGVRETERDASVMADGLGGTFKLECQRDKGALLILREPADRQKLARSASLPRYVARNIGHWRSFIRDECDIDLKVEDIIFVSGWSKTTEWALTSYAGGEWLVEIDFTANSDLQATALGRLPDRRDVTIYHRSGRSRSRVPTAEVADDKERRQPTRRHNGTSLSTTINYSQDPPRKDQCVFLHYFQVKQRAFSPVEAAAAVGPDTLDLDDVNNAESLTSGSPRYVNEPAEDSVIRKVPSGCKPYDPDDILLDYILEHSDAEWAVACDEDTEIISMGEEFPGDLVELLNALRPNIQTDSLGVGTFDHVMSVITSPTTTVAGTTEYSESLNEKTVEPDRRDKETDSG
ncbi:uncharacterized protein LAESUDRAFT_765027 [Laetiporus sulphureus 93-53]|uniref:Uncharacterized protein n=1 Tax=Laetiporus sulphureus 93-53 TaxID=1314785 RepID=A0A165B0D9_9APHY|nr:uncharacterized protein LAESUDRAFT_765027 [Laetiporus sulphureus 93-53]KZS99992.1 hypothetical protein LAESUDRAFT_765027 [Laetiporus sulphureus 93-53]